MHSAACRRWYSVYFIDFAARAAGATTSSPSPCRRLQDRCPWLTPSPVPVGDSDSRCMAGLCHLKCDLLGAIGQLLGGAYAHSACRASASSGCLPPARFFFRLSQGMQGKAAHSVPARSVDCDSLHLPPARFLLRRLGAGDPPIRGRAVHNICIRAFMRLCVCARVVHVCLCACSACVRSAGMHTYVWARVLSSLCPSPCPAPALHT